ncbi:MAG: RCC1 domain-containing protein [Sandaracinaceae bacterium]|nr:RCC1 domain-containing protein [Sandaracinaceae bacterium]
MTTSTLSAIRIIETGDTSCAIEGAAGDLYCWGSDTYGQVGDGASTGALAPRAIGLGGVSHVSAGSRVTCAVAADGVYCWGDGPLGDGTASSSAVPVAVPALYEP